LARRCYFALCGEAQLIDLWLVIEVLDFDFRIRHGYAVGQDNRTKDAAHPVRVGFIQRDDFDRQSQRLIPTAG
jgi:hypothetical protein